MSLAARAEPPALSTCHRVARGRFPKLSKAFASVNAADDSEEGLKSAVRAASTCPVFGRQIRTARRRGRSSHAGGGGGACAGGGLRARLHLHVHRRLGMRRADSAVWGLVRCTVPRAWARRVV